MKHILCLLYSIIIFQPIYAQEPDTLYGIINKTDGSITFAVDENLPAPRSGNTIGEPLVVITLQNIF